MANWAKQVRRAAAEHVQPDEPVRLGISVQPIGMAERRASRGPVMKLTRVVADALGKEMFRREFPLKREGLAAEMPAGLAVLAITDCRLLVCGMSAATGRATQLDHVVPLSDLDTVEVDKHRLMSVLTLRFVDGSAVEYEVRRFGNDPEGFAEMVNGS